MIDNIINLAKEYWELLKTYWYVPLIGYIPLRFIEWIVRFILKKVFGVVFIPLRVLRKNIGDITLFEWILIGLLAVCIGVIIYLSLMIKG